MWNQSARSILEFFDLNLSRPNFLELPARTPGFEFTDNEV